MAGRTSKEWSLEVKDGEDTSKTHTTMARIWTDSPLPSAWSSNWESHDVSTSKTNDHDFRSQLRNWWHELIRENGKYHCYLILLALSSDKEAVRYFKEYGREIDVITGNNCLVIALTSNLIEESNSWNKAIDEHIEKGYTVKIAELFDVSLEKFPSLLVFQDIRSPEHMIYPLKNQTAEQISQLLRMIMSTVNQSIKNGTTPLEGLSQKENKDKIIETGKNVVGTVKTLANKTLESAVQALVESAIK